jgi:hypothetical protein
MFLVPNIDQMYKEMKKIVEVGNKHGNGDKFPDFVDLFFFLASFFLGSVDRKHTYFKFFWPNVPTDCKPEPAFINSKYLYKVFQTDVHGFENSKRYDLAH